MVLCRSRVPCPPLHIQEANLLVGYNKGVIVGLHDSNVTRITCEKPSRTRSYLFLTGYPETISQSGEVVEWAHTKQEALMKKKD
jgi:hypothetical protein